MSLDSKIIKIGMLCAALTLNPLSPEQEVYAQSSPLVSETDARRLDKELIKKYSDSYDSLFAKYGTDLGSAVFEGLNLVNIRNPLMGIDAFEKNMQSILNHSELKLFPKKLMYKLIEYGVTSTSWLPEYLIKTNDALKMSQQNYTLEKATQNLCDIVDILAESTIGNVILNEGELISFYLFDNIAYFNNVDYARALRIRSSPDRIFENGKYITSKKYGPEVAGAILIACERSESKKEYICDIADSLKRKGYDDTLVAGVISAIGYGSLSKGNISYNGNNSDRTGDILFMTSLLVGKYNSKAISTILNTCANRWWLEDLYKR